MKKWLVVLVAMMLTFSLTACGLLSNLKDAVSGEASEPADGPTVTVGGNEDESESEGDTSGPVININGEEEEESEVAEGSYDICSINTVRENMGIMSGSVKNQDSNETVNFAYNFKTGEATLLPNYGSGYTYDKYILEQQPDTESRNERYDNSETFVFNMQIKDMSTGEVIYAFPENMAVAAPDNIMPVLVVFEVNESFEGNTYAMGLMSYEGEWILPLKSDWPWLTDERCLRGSVGYLGNGGYAFGSGYAASTAYYVLDIETQAVSSLAVPAADLRYETEYIDSYNLAYYEDGCLYYFGDSKGVFSYNIETGEKKQLIDSSNFKVTHMSQNGVYWFRTDNTIYVCNKDKHVATYNMSEYADASIVKADEKAILFTMNNADGTQYLCLMRPDGTMVFEPVKTENLGGYKYLNQDKMAYFDYSTYTLYVCDIESGEVTSNTLPESSSMQYYCCDEENAYIIVCVYDSLKGWLYYIVDADDAETLINPFE